VGSTTERMYPIQGWLERGTLWTIADQLPSSTGVAYRWVVMGLTLAALIGGLVFPFGQLVGVIYPFIGLFGLAFCISLLVWQIRRRRALIGPVQ